MDEAGLSLVAPYYQSETMVKDPLFTIIIATYKRPHLLSRAICSVVGQTFRDFECIVVDDAGHGGSAQIVQQFHDERIRLIEHERNKGVAAASNTGINAARGSLIAMLDDDDEYYPAFLERMYQFFQAAHSRIGFAWTGIRKVFDTPEGEVLWYEKVWPAKIRPHEAAYVAATTIGKGYGLMMRRECLDAVGPYREAFRVREDTDYLFRLVGKYEFATIPEVLVKLHRHKGDQLTGRGLDELRLELHERILMENADFIAHYPMLYDVHYRQLALNSYSLGMKRKGRKILLKLFKNRPSPSFLLDLVCYEWFGVDAATVWGQRGVRTIFSRMNRTLRSRESHGI